MPDAWTFDRESLSLVKGVRVARLTRKAGEVLDCLIRHHGRTVSQEALLREVWPGLHVTPDLVREYVSDLRALLGDDPRAPRFIETVRGRGYRLVGAIAPAPGTGAAPVVRVAVLPLADRSPDDRWSRLAQEVGADIAAELIRYPDIAVVAHRHDASGDLRAIGGILGVRYLVDGALTVRSEVWRARVDLVEGATGRLRWSRCLQGSTAQLPALSETVAAAVAGALGGVNGEIWRLDRELVRRKPPATLDAYENYVIGRDAETSPDEAGVRRAIHHLEASVRLDPHFARAWLVLGWARYQMAAAEWGGDPAEWSRRSDEATLRAFACDPRDPLIAADVANVLSAQGRLSEALVQIERAADLCANNPEALTFLSLGMCLTAGDGPRALALVDRALALNPAPLGWLRYFEARAAFFAGDFRRSLDAAAKAEDDALPTHVYRCLSAAELGLPATNDYWAALRATYPSFDPRAYAATAGIRHPAAVSRYEAATARLATLVAQSASSSPSTPASSRSSVS